jgi:hypothetical protein
MGSKWIFRRLAGRVWNGPVAGCCEHGNEPSGSGATMRLAITFVRNSTDRLLDLRKAIKCSIYLIIALKYKVFESHSIRFK